MMDDVYFNTDEPNLKADLKRHSEEEAVLRERLARYANAKGGYTPTVGCRAMLDRLLRSKKRLTDQIGKKL